MIQTSNEITELPTNDRHRLLASERRRLVLEILDRSDTPIELEELAAKIAAREDGDDASNGDIIGRMVIELHHLHLPFMTDMGILYYRPDAKLIWFP